MQTFLPFPDYMHSAIALDDKRLGKQRVEVLQILRTLLGITDGWANHPAVKMWRGHEAALSYYGQVICDEWVFRSFNDTVKGKIIELVPETDKIIPAHFNEAFHRSHQSNLLRKDPVHYGYFFPDVPNDLPYVWPMPGGKR